MARWGSRGLCLLIAWGLVACRDPGEGDRASEPPPSTGTPIVLVVIDTLRADHVGSYGYPLATTPNLDALGFEADRYTRAKATAPWTVPSHASLFTGLEAFEHGAQARLVDGELREFPLGREHETLAEALRRAGYPTAAIVENGPYLAARHGFAQGFDLYDDQPASRASREGRADVVRLGLDWIDTEAAGRPFFLFLNVMPAHRPYHTAPLPQQRGALPLPALDDPSALLDELAAAVLGEPEPPNPELVRRVISQYDYGIAHADLAVGELIAGLKERGLWQDALFIVTSDHGEYFGEHDLVEHSKDVYEEALAVPLFIKRPDQRAPRVLNSRISLAALPSLIARELQGPAGPALTEAFPERAPKAPAFAELRYTRPRDLDGPYGERFRRIRSVIYRDEHKAIWSSDGEHEVYDLIRDPKEESNLLESDPALAAGLLGEIERARKRSGETPHTRPPIEFDPDEIEQLRGLGYVD